MPLERCLQYKSNYEHLLSIESDTYVAPIHPVSGKQIKPVKMPWMVDIWKRGLALVTEVISEKQKDINQLEIFS
jgi:hypothetical protein